MSNKNFDDWIVVKEDLHNSFVNGKMPTFKEGDVFWCGFGENVGVEINGKHEDFSRPVLILKKLNKESFFGVPLSTKDKTGTWYVHFVFQNRRQIAVLSQIRTMSASRLYNKMGSVSKADFQKVRAGFLGLFA